MNATLRYVGLRLRSACGSLCLTLLVAAAARADDTEIYVSRTSASGIRPNVLLIFDNSVDMGNAVSTGKAPYDPTQVYDGDCLPDRIYWRRGSSAEPACSTDSFFPRTLNECRAATNALAGDAGIWTGRALEWDEGDDRWEALEPGFEHDDDDDEGHGDEEYVECESDRGVHGPSSGSEVNELYARNGSRGPWTNFGSREISWSGASFYTFYSANWLNWFHAPPDPNSQITRLEAMKSAAATILNSVNGVNVGLMTFAGNTEGGLVTNAIGDIASNRSALLASLDGIQPDVAASPLSETLYEAGQYLAGRAVDFGTGSVSASRQDPPDTYLSPIEFQCQRNYIIFMSEGVPSGDVSADDKIPALPAFSSINPGGCNASLDNGRCLVEMARYLNQKDLGTGDLLNGTQNVVTYTVGFGPEATGSALLDQVAEAGGGEAFAADDVANLTVALQQVVSDLAERSSTFTTPSVAVNAFNRTQTTNELYISVFEPTDTARWPGNLKKYRLDGGRIVDAAGRDAIDPVTGFFSDDARSLWTVGDPDGKRVDAGGAASLLPSPMNRKMYTFIEAEGDRDLTAGENALSTANAALTDALLGTSAESDPTRNSVVEWARGVDLRDANANGSISDQSHVMGDPLHARPVLVTYGTTAGNAVVFTPTNDGFLHATAADTGIELWSFIPQELLARLADLYRDAGVVDRSYGLDGDIRVLRFDVDQDGTIESSDGDRIFIYFGMRRGGRFYYALDVTNRTSPRILWRTGASATLGADSLPGVGETWSPPTLARIDVDDPAQHAEKIVLIVGGGYDAGQEDFEYREDTSGHRIYIVDALNGKLLWYAGGPDGGGTPDLPLAHMTHSIPARISVIDRDGNGFADRLYTADTGGRVWRFDIRNGRNRAELVTGGVFANLGAAGSETPALADTRRFYYAPDVALIQRRGADPYYNLAIGSGYRGHPLHLDTRNSFYSLRDTQPFASLDQSTYEAEDFALTEADLEPITDFATASVPRNRRGWKLDLTRNGLGEKVLAEAVTVGGTVLFPTYQPQPADSNNPCVPANGINRAYALRVDSGRPAVDFNDDASIDEADAWTRLTQAGIAGEITFALESRRGSDGSEGEGSDQQADSVPHDALGRRALCLVGVEVLSKCVGPGDVVRTFWQRTNTN